MNDFLVISYWPADQAAAQRPRRVGGARYRDSGDQINAAKRLLRSKGWSYRGAAPVLGVHHVHLALVLTGRRESRRLLDAIKALPVRSE